MRILAPILSTIMILSTPGLVLATEGQVKCIGCMPIQPNPIEELTAPTQAPVPAPIPVPAPADDSDTILHEKAGRITAKLLDYWGIGKVCSKFADANGFGPYAKVISDRMTPQTHPALYAGTKDIVRNCKSFALFGEQQKEDFYTYLFAHLAYAESSCDPTEFAPGPNGRAQGLLALHKNREQIYTDKDNFITKCKMGDSKTAEKSLRCGLAMLDGQFTAKSELFARTGYWGPFTPQTKKRVTVHYYDSKRPGKRRAKSETLNVNTFIKTAIKNYPFCK